MASSSFAPESLSGCRIPLAEIDSVVSARLGPTRGLGNSQPACFNRQVAMYLAARVGRWSTKIIGRFYNGRDHSTVCHGIQRIEALRENDPEVDALLSDLKRRLAKPTDDSVAEIRTEADKSQTVELSEAQIEQMADLIVARVCSLLNAKSEDLDRFHERLHGTLGALRQLPKFASPDKP